MLEKVHVITQQTSTMRKLARYATSLNFWLRFGVVAMTAVAATRIAWVSDDAMITLRHALNITHGWGPGFNSTEAVQGYTHPLWFLMWTAVGSLSGQWIIGIIVLSVTMTAGAVAIVVGNAKTPTVILIAGFALVLSNAFIEWSTSGLENPASYLAVAALVATVTNSGLHRATRRAMFVGLSCAAVLLLRFDYALLVGPLMLVWFWKGRKDLKVVAATAVAAITPLAIWFTWSWVTYSTFLPNTFEAKNNVDIPTSMLIGRGLQYLGLWASYDIVGFLTLLIACTIALIAGDAPLRAVVVGVAAYITYVVFIGGDFMAGRFFAVPLLAAVLAAVVAHTRATDGVSPQMERQGTANDWGFLRRKWAGPIGVVTAALLLTVSLSAVSKTPSAVLLQLQTSRWNSSEHGFILDALVVHHFQQRALFSKNDFPQEIEYVVTLAEANEVIQNYPHATGEETLPERVEVVCGNLAITAIRSGPAVHWIDTCALTDRFLASQPFVVSKNTATVDWMPGHFERTPPEGYVEAVAAGDPTKVEDGVLATRLADLWKKIR